MYSSPFPSFTLALPLALPLALALALPLPLPQPYTRLQAEDVRYNAEGQLSEAESRVLAGEEASLKEEGDAWQAI